MMEIKKLEVWFEKVINDKKKIKMNEESDS